MECMKCKYITTNKQNYYRHLHSKRHLEEKTNKYSCEKCQYTTINKQHYERHLQSKRHLEEKTNEYHCEMCQYTTINKQNFEVHLRSNKHIEGSKFKDISFSKPIEVISVPVFNPMVDRPRLNPFRPFHTTFCAIHETINLINQFIKENEENEKKTFIEEQRIRIYARKIGDNYKVAIIPMEKKTDYFKLGLLTKEKLKELSVRNPKFENIEIDDTGFGGFHHILGYIESDLI
jgi:hypothetical protein